MIVEPVEQAARPTTSRPGGTVGTDQDTGRLVDVTRDIDHVLHDLDEIAAKTGRTALDVLRDHDGATDERAAGIDDQLLTLCRLAGRTLDQVDLECAVSSALEVRRCLTRQQ